MTIVELAILTRETRLAQSVYFGARPGPEKMEALKVAKSLERRLDIALHAILDNKNN